jgi:hypothetical protein
MIATSTKNYVVFLLENPSVPAAKRQKRNPKGHSRPITSSIEASTSSRTSVSKPRNDGVIAQAGDKHLSNVPSHPERQLDITPYSEEGRNTQHGDIMDLGARDLCQEIVVDAYETSREADIRERQWTENGGELVRNPCSRPVANTTIVEHTQTPVVIADSAAADDTSYSPRPFGQDGPEQSRSPSLLSPPSPDVISSSATAIVGVSGEGTTLAESAGQTSVHRKFVCTPLRFESLICRTGATPNWHKIVLGANGICDYLSSDVT